MQRSRKFLRRVATGSQGRGAIKNAPSVELRGVFGSPPPELPNYLPILGWDETSVNVTSVT
jgi:hypothetical protein